MKLLVVDGNSIVNRAFYGIKALTTKNGEFTNGIYGFLMICGSLLSAICFMMVTKPIGKECPKN